MTWLRIDDKAGDDPKLVVLSDAAYRAVINSWIYCAKHETDGKLPARMAEDFTRRSIKVRAEIVAQGLWHENGAGYVVHNFNKRNPTHAALEAERASAAERKRRSRQKGSKS